MRRHVPTVLATLVSMTLYSSYAQADLAQQCLLGVPIFDRPFIEGDMGSLPVHIQSDNTSFDYPANAIFDGNVTITQGNRRLVAERAVFEQMTSGENLLDARTVTATGNVVYDDNLIKLQGSKAWSDLNNKDADIIDTYYQMVGRQGRGEADKIQLRNNRYVKMQNGSFTTCLPNDSSWRIVGSEIVQDNEEEVAEIWNARFMLGPVPVFYSPYLQFPTGNKRRSGLLLPSGKYSSGNGIQFAVPYYWNIAPNFDATITPNLIARRGLQWQNEFRYLLTPGQGLFQLDWLPDDRLYQRDNPDSDRDSRWLLHWQHNGLMDKVWRSNVYATRVSDSKYFADLDSQYGASTSGYLRQSYSVGYANRNWNSTLYIKQFQVLTNSVEPYRAEPILDYNVYQNDIGPFDFHTYAQYARFSNDSPFLPEANRFHIEPSLSLPLSNRWGSLTSEVKLLSTYYDQDIPDSFVSSETLDLKKSASRTVPQYKVNGKLVFERDTTTLTDYTQTLEPRVQYLFTPYRNQSDIYNYDSTLLQSDYAGLFRDRQYSGLDRVASANQIVSGVTTRLYDDKLDERFNVSVGQIYYFDAPRTGDGFNAFNRDDRRGSLVWASDTYWKYDDNLSMRAGVQYDDRLDSIAVGDAVLEYRKDSQRLIQLNYRYASQEYISAMASNLDYNQTNYYQQDISQIGTVGSWPINDNWTMVGAYYFDPGKKQTVNSLAGVQYSTCCWGVSVSMERKIVGWNREGYNSNYDNKVSFNVEIRGLGPNSPNSEKMLRSNIIPYQRAF